MTPEAKQIYNLISNWAADYEATKPGTNPKHVASRAEFARLLRVAAAAVERDGQVSAPVREAAE